MAVFKTVRTIPVQNADLSALAEHITRIYTDKGFEVKTEPTAQGCLISLTQGGLFKMALGMKMALNVKLTEKPGMIHAEASVGVFGMQVLPALIAYYITWPVLLTQIWGMIKQSKLDDEVIAAVEEFVKQPAAAPAAVLPAGDKLFCTQCGAQQNVGDRFCCKCGAMLC